MAGEKFIKNNAGTLTEQKALQTSVGAADAGKIPALDATGRIDASMLPVGIGADTVIIQASETLDAGSFVNVWNDGGDARARLADASTAGKEAHGFVLAQAVSGTAATVYFEGSNTQVTGATPGVVFLHTDAGGFTSTAPTSTGSVVQRLGVATSATSINFEYTQPIVLA